jgi:hypothetical protein
MTDHGIVAADWQLDAADRLTAIVLPLVLQIETHPDGSFYWPNTPATAWMFKTIEQIIKCNEFPYQIGDRVYLKEQWNQPNSTSLAIAKSQACPGSVAEKTWHWNPAETMPPEVARYWVEVTAVKVVQMRDVLENIADCSGLSDAALFTGEEGAWKNFWKAAKKNWNAAHPKHPWQRDRWVVVLEVKNAKKSA